MKFCPLIVTTFAVATAGVGSARAGATDGPAPRTTTKVPHVITDITQPPIGADAAAKLPDAGLWFAGLTSYNSGEGDSELYIYQITKAGPKAVFSEPHNRSWGAGWQDAHTFVVVDFADKAGNINVRSFRDGVLAKTIVVKPADWKLKADAKTPDLPELRFAGTTLWLEACLQYTETVTGRCVKTAAVKIVGEVVTPAKAAPKNARTGNVRATPPTIKAPLAPVVKARNLDIEGSKVKGLECKLNGAAVTWPSAATINWQFAPQVKKITWHSVIPPLYSASGPASNPVGEVATVTRTFRGCAPEPMDGFRWIRKAIWAESVVHTHPDGAVSHTTWHVYADHEPIAVLLASDMSFYPAPAQ